MNRAERLQGIMASAFFDWRVRQLMAEAAEAGDFDQVAMCERAIAGDDLAALGCADALDRAEAMIEGGRS